MDNTAIQLQIKLLEQMIDLEEKNYREAITSTKDYFILRKIRENIRGLKQQLASLKEKA